MRDAMYIIKNKRAENRSYPAFCQGNGTAAEGAASYRTSFG